MSLYATQGRFEPKPVPRPSSAYAAGASPTVAGPIPIYPAGELPEDLPQIELPGGTRLFEQKTRPTSAYYLVSGIVKLMRKTEHGRSVPVAIRTRGAFVGAGSALLSMEHPVGAETVTVCQAYHMSAEHLRRTARRDAEFGHRLAMILSQELMSSVNQVGRLVSMTRKRNLELLLKTFANGTGQPGEAVRISMPLTMRDLSALMGITPEHLSRLLRKLEDEGVLLRDKGRLFWRNPIKVAAAAAGEDRDVA